ncbi:MAG TPA: hypothetical protein DEP87_01845 [Candidatus Pacebacteria bacterium]|nr:hypothetical protein [Candidatus Paceibacterota bacterium]
MQKINPGNQKTLAFFSWPIGAWLIWRLGLILIGLGASFWLPYRPSFPYFDSLLPGFGWPQWFYSWANFDGVHYLTIAAKGYLGTGLIQAFFPVYPIIVGLISRVTQLDLMMSGWWLNQLLSLILVCLLWFWWRTKFGITAARWGLVWWLVFPTSFFLGSFYSESLYICLALGSWLMAKKGSWGAAALLAALASGTRIIGFWLLPMLGLELLSQTYPQLQLLSLTNFLVWVKREKRHLLLLLLSLGGLVAYMGYLQLTFQDALYFLHQQSEFGAGRQEALIWWPQVIWRASKILLTARPFDWKYLTYVQELVFGVGSVLLVFWGWWQRKTTQLTTPLAVYSLGCLLMPTLTGTFSSLPRYVLAAWPMWLSLISLSTQPEFRWVKWLALAISLTFLIINTSLFIQGYWVA